MEGNPNSSQYDFKGKSIRPPPSSYKPTPSQGGPIGTAGRPTSTRGMNFSNDLAKKAKEIEGSKYREELSKKVTSPQQFIRSLQREVHKIIQECAVLRSTGSALDALEKAKQAIVKEKALKKARESAPSVENQKQLTALVTLNHALSLEAAGMLQQAITKYNQLIKSKQFQFPGRVRVNLGNIYFAQQKYVAAIRMYKMAIDILPNTSKEMRMKITRNIAHAHVRLGQSPQAITCYETILKSSADHRTAYNLIICLYAKGDKLRMKDCFTSMITNAQEEEEQEETLIDKLKEQTKAKRKEEIRLIVNAAKLIAPVIQNDIIESYDWILQKLKSSSYPQVQSEVEIFKAMAYLKRKEIEKAIETLKELQRKDKQTMSRVASNISFLYFLQNNYAEAEKYVDIALQHDYYNAKALVNKGNCFYMRNDFRMAKDRYLEAIGVEADCVEALYNLGFVNKKLNLFTDALQALEKIQTLISIPQTIFQIATINEILGRTKQALKWYQIILTKLPNDASVLARVGNIFFREDDQQQALHYYLQSYRLLPTSADTNTWLGIYYVKQCSYEKACFYLERVSQIQPKEVKWRLMVASCQRRIGNFQKALKLYQTIYQEYPDNIQCLRFLVFLCKDMGLDYEEYAKELRMQELEQQPIGDYEDDNLKNINEQEQEQETVKVDKRRLMREAPKPAPKKDDDWDDEGINVGL